MTKCKCRKYRKVLKDIQIYVSGHCDFEADINDCSPEDMEAHINGIIYQMIDKALNKK